MKFRVNKGSDFPIYQQLKEQIKYFLLSGALQSGTQVPPPKDLALYLHINRNTVIAAYKELEKEGLLVMKHGQGTYVSGKLPPLPDEERKQALIALVRDALERTAQLGFSAEDLFTVVFNKTVLGLDSPPRTELRALLVECNMQDLQYFQKELQEELGIRVDGCLLPELPGKVQEEFVTGTDFVITTFFHVEDVKAILEPLDKEVVAIMAAPHLHTLMRVSQLPPGTRVGLTCADGAQSMRLALEAAGIQHITLENAGFNDKESLNRMLNRVNWVVGSRVVIEALRAIAPPGVQVMEYSTVLDPAGLQMLKQYLEKKQQATNIKISDKG